MKAASTTSPDVAARDLGRGRPAGKGETVISTLGLVLYWVLGVYLAFLFARMIIGWVAVASSSLRHKEGPLAAFCELVFTVTDPPLKFLGRFIPPLQIGRGIAIDLGFILLVIVIFVLQSQVQRL